MDEPVIVLTCARSGSTLLRLILDAHPELACPPETGIVHMCSQMGALWLTLDPRPGGQPGLSDLARASVRSWTANTFAAYLMRDGKRRWCDKSIGSAESAGRFLDLFPRAKFICLYRHCMDVIDSVFEARPWGLRGYGLDPYAAAHPGNSVAAVADFWVCETNAIMAFEEAHQDACLRLRYEDLVADPEGQAGRLFAFLGEEHVPGITRACLQTERRTVDPADFKIWTTSSIRADSVGRGARIPAHTIPLGILEMINGLLKPLGYPLVDENWGSIDENWPHDTLPVTAVLFDQIETLLTSQATAFAAAQPHDLDEEVTKTSFTITATLGTGVTGPASSRSWKIDMLTSSITRTGIHDVAGDVSPGTWEISGAATTWQSVLSGQLNLGTAIRQGHLRYNSMWDADPSIPLPLRQDPRTSLLTRWLTAGILAEGSRLRDTTRAEIRGR